MTTRTPVATLRRFGLAAMLLAAAPTTAAPAKAPHMTVDLIAEASSWRNGQDLAVGVLLTPERGWHVYWKNAGDSGTAPVLTWRLPAGWRAGDIAWPAPQRITEGPLVSFGYTGPVLLIVHLTPPADDRAAGPRDIAVAASWLVCKDTCVPGKADLVLALPAGTGKPGPHASLFARTRTLVPAPLPASWMVTAAPTEKTLVISFSGTGTTLRSPVAFFPANPNEIENAAPQALAWGAGGAHLALLKSDQLTKLPASLDGVLVAGTRAWELRLPLAGDPPTATAAGLALWWALVLAFTGGMILNLMPCVFPVLSIKVLGFVRESMHHPHEVKVHGLLYGAGVIASFWALSGALFILKAGGEHLGWGFQLQSPMVIIILAAVLFLIGLNLFGVFETGTSVMRTAGSFSWGEGRAAAFFTGVLAVFLATPCTAPFMGTALGYAATQPIHSGFLVFTALGLGMAAPYVALSFAPHLGRLLPRPGRWMETFKHAMAFPLMATVIWLLWVLGLQSGLVAVIQALATMLAVAFAGWLYGRWHTGIMRGVAGAIIGVACIAAVIAVRDIATAKASDRDNSWERWSAARQERALSSGKPVFVDFTAAWCLTCKVNEVVALGTVDVRKAFKEHGVVMLQADWTNPDREIEKALAEFGRNGVPLYVLYPGGRSVPPVLLPQILTPRSVLNELEKLGGGG